MTTKTLLAAAVLGLGVAPAAAQEAPQTGQMPQAQAGQAQDTAAGGACMEDLRAFGLRIQEDGYWLTGIRDQWGAGWGGAATGTGYYPGVGVPGNPMMADPAAPAGDPTVAGDPALQDDPAMADPMADPMAEGAGAPQLWGVGLQSPGVQIETLFRAAQVLALEGRAEGCAAVLAELQMLYDDYAMRLQEAGVEPGQVTTWRRDILLTAQPVGELDLSRVSIEQLTGTEVRNLQDEYLGDVNDVVLAGGRVEHVVISRGGFLGLGQDHVLVPWEELGAPPGMAMILLDVPVEVLEQAPQVSGDLVSLTGDQDARVRAFWQEARGRD